MIAPEPRKMTSILKEEVEDQDQSDFEISPILASIS